MSKLEQLLEGVEVEWKTLGELVKLVKGKQLNKELLSVDGLYPAYNGGTSFSGFTDVYNYNENTTIISQGGASAGFVNFVKTKFFANAHCYVILPKIEIVENRYIYHFLKLSQESLMTKKHGAGIPALRTNEILEIPIPIPCPDNSKKSLSIQKEIARILDTFTELTAELTTELAARKNQYSYYREQLLSFEDGEVEWKSFGEVGELVRGNGLPKSDFTETGIPAIHYGQIYTYYGTYTKSTKSFVSVQTAKKLSKVNKGDVILTNTSENLEDVGKAVVYLGEEQAVTGGHATIFKPSKFITGKYFAYFTQTEMFAIQKRKYAKGTKVIDVSAKDMAKILIPVPSPEEQERIVSILDKFDILTTSISEGLPKEIELRKKQYEYYRDLLLTFPKNNIES